MQIAPYPSSFHESTVPVWADEPPLKWHHLSTWLVLVCSKAHSWCWLGFDICIMISIYHCGIIQRSKNSFIILSPWTLENIMCTVFSGIVCCWEHMEAFSAWFPSLCKMPLCFLHMFLYGLIATFSLFIFVSFLSTYDTILSRCGTVYSLTEAYLRCDEILATNSFGSNSSINIHL